MLMIVCIFGIVSSAGNDNHTEFGIRDNVPNTDVFFFFGIRDIVLDI